MIGWDDYRLVLGIARRGRIVPAADDLGVTQSTVFRRLADIETQVGCPLFHRDNGIYTPTEDGAHIVAAAERMEQETASALRHVTGHDQQLRGTVTITASESLSVFFVARHVGQIRQDHPELAISVLSGNQTLSLANLEADIAIRPSRPTDATLFGRKMGDIRWAIFAPNDENGDVIGLSTAARASRTMIAAQRHLPDRDALVQSNSLLLNANLAVHTGSSVALPMVVGEQWPGLTRISDPFSDDFGELWIVCHNDMRRNAKVRVVFDTLVAAAQTEKHLFQGA